MSLTPTANFLPHAVNQPGISTHRFGGTLPAGGSIYIWPGFLFNPDVVPTDATKEPSYGTLYSWRFDALVTGTALVSAVNVYQTIGGFTSLIEGPVAFNVPIGTAGMVQAFDKRCFGRGYVTLELAVSAGTGAWFGTLQTLCA